MGEEQARGASPPAPKRARLEPGAGAGGADVVAQQQAENKASGRTGGIYVPPFKIAALRQQTAGLDASSREFQKLSWESLRKGINGHVNKVNVSNIRSIVPELLELNLVRGRGLLCRALMKAQLASPGSTPPLQASSFRHLRMSVDVGPWRQRPGASGSLRADGIRRS